MSELDSLLESARSAEPPPLEDLEALLSRAGAQGAARHRAWIWRRLIAATAIGSAIAASAAIALWPSEQAPRTITRVVEREGLLELELPTGDAITATAGARFHVEEATNASRRIRVRSGIALFDVVPLEPDQSFEVVTAELTARVTGTVFSVEAGDETIVRVYEGSVAIDEDGETRTLSAGESYESGGGEAPARGPLDDRGERAALDRHAPAPVAPVAPAPRAVRREPSESDVRRLIGSGRAGEALRAARDARRRGGPADPWSLLEGDALRALQRSDEAAAVYENAIDELSGDRRAQAGFLAANLRASDPARALSLLERSGADAPGSPLRERALALEWSLYGSLDRADQRRRVAEAYLHDFPDGSRARTIRAWAESAPP